MEPEECGEGQGQVLRGLVCMLRGLDFSWLLQQAGSEGSDPQFSKFCSSMDSGSQGPGLVAGNQEGSYGK